MAGKFLSLEEAARRLGVSIDEVNRLVDRKELFPMRDGATIKFKVDEIERVAADLGGGGGGSGVAEDDLALDLELSAPGLGGSLIGPDSEAGGSGGGDLVLDQPEDEASIFAGDDDAGPVAGSQTVVRGGDAAAASGMFEDDLALESIVGASSSPSLGGGSPSSPAADSGTLAIDLSNLGGSLAGSVPGLSATGGSGAGGSLAGAVDSGLSLEDGSLDVSGIDLDKSLAGGGADDVLGGSLAGDAFELGAGVADEESASVVIPTEDTGDSSFFGDAMDDSASVSFDGSSVSGDMPMADLAGLDLVPAAAPFTVWQVVGLVCCTILLFVAGLVVFDVLATIRGPQGSPISSPLLNALAETFGW